MKKMVSIVIIVVAVGLIVLGGQKWLHRRDVNAVVNQFFSSIEAGKSAPAMQLLSPELRQSLSAKNNNRDVTSLFSPEPGLAYSIQETEITGSQSIVSMLIQKDGFTLKPIVHLKKSSTNRWRITEIKNLIEDPLWKDMLKEQARQQDNQLASDLQKAFSNQKGIMIESRE